MSRQLFLAVAGNIGVGKTHLTRYLGERLGWEVFYEPVIDNPYLDDFYADMRRWSFHLQVFFLSRRFEMHRKMMDNLLSCVQDRTIYEDAEVFARTLHSNGAMDDRDYENYQSLFACMTSYLRPPDTVIYLRASVPTLLRRIQHRGRECERNIDPAYLQMLSEAYDDWAARSAPDLPFLVVDTDDIGEIHEHPAIVRLLATLEHGSGPAPLGDAGRPEPPGARS